MAVGADDVRTVDAICEDLIDNCRKAVAPVAHLTDAEIEACPDYEPPVRHLLVNLRRILRASCDA